MIIIRSSVTTKRVFVDNRPFSEACQNLSEKTIRSSDPYLKAGYDAKTLTLSHDAQQAVEIIIQYGIYRLDTTLILGPEDSGVTWRAAEGAEPALEAEARGAYVAFL